MKNHCFCLFTSTIYSNRKRFPCLQLFAKPVVLETREELEEFETAVQTRDAGYEFEGLHITVKFSQPLSCLHQAMQTQEKSFLLLL